MKLDLHVHTAERSPCGTRTEQQQIEAAIAAGLDGIALTDHDRLAPRDQLQSLNQRYAPFKIFTGIEVTASTTNGGTQAGSVQAGSMLHFVVIGLYDLRLESRDWYYPDLLAYTRAMGGFLFYAHPYRYSPHLIVDLEQHTPDGIEIESINTPVERRAEIQDVAERLGLALMRNSDGHHTDGVGRFYNTLPGTASSDTELVELLHALKLPRQNGA